jgi:hypothetical protein
MNQRTYLIGAAVLAAAVLTWALVERMTRPTDAAQAAPLARATVQAASAAKGATAAVAMQAAVPASSPVVPDLPVEDMVATLVKDGKPGGKLAAYYMIEQCLSLERTKEVVTGAEVKFQHGQHIIDLKKADPATVAKVRAHCASLTGVTRRARVGYLKDAYEARAPGALLAYLMAGPDGDKDALTMRPDDPMVQSWKADLRARIKKDLHAGDEEAMRTSLMVTQTAGSDLPKPVAAYVDLVLMTTVTTPNKPLPDYLNLVRDALTPDQRALAQAELDTILGAWRKRKQNAGANS